MKKYYVEICDKRSDDTANYIAQSKWFNKSTTAYEWYKSFDFIDDRYKVCIMSSNFVEGHYTDINYECTIGIDGKCIY